MKLLPVLVFALLTQSYSKHSEPGGFKATHTYICIHTLKYLHTDTAFVAGLHSCTHSTSTINMDTHSSSGARKRIIGHVLQVAHRAYVPKKTSHCMTTQTITQKHTHCEHRNSNRSHVIL